MRLGAPLFSAPDDPAAIAAEHRRLGYGAAYCPKVTLADGDRVRAIREAFAAADVTIAEVGAWNNMLDRDEAKRTANIDYVCERLALADEVGATCCVNIAGSRNPTRWDGPHPENLSEEVFEVIVDNVRYVLDTVRPTRTRFAIEMTPHTLPDGSEAYRRMVEAVDRPAFAVHLDPANVVSSPRRYYDTTSLLRECFATLGPWVVSCHAKDTLMHEALTVHIDEVRPGLGTLDYATFLTELSRLPGDVPLMLEHLETAEEYAAGTEYIRRVASEVGLAFNGA